MKIVNIYTVLTLTTTILIACNNTNTEAPSLQNKQETTILPEEEFIKLMTDIQLIEGHLNTNRVEQVFIMDSAHNYYKHAFDKYNITEQDYKANLKHYAANPKLLEKIYIKVEENLVLMDRYYTAITDTLPAITPLNRNKLTQIIKEDSLALATITNDTLSYKAIKDSLFTHFTNQKLAKYNTDTLSFQQSFNVSTHTTPMFNLFKNSLK